MPKIDRNEYMNAEAKQGGGGFAQMEPGVYELYIQAIRTEWDTKNGHTKGEDKQCVRIIWDVASGDFERKFTDAYFVDWSGQPDPEKDFMHSCFLSWKNLEYLKGRFEAINAANGGFDALSAFEAIPDKGMAPEHWQQFINKRFWAVVDGTVTLNDNGYDRWALDIGAWITPEQARTGEHPEPQITDNRTKAKGGGGASGALYGGATLDV